MKKKLHFDIKRHQKRYFKTKLYFVRAAAMYTIFATFLFAYLFIWHVPNSSYSHLLVNTYAFLCALSVLIFIKLKKYNYGFNVIHYFYPWIFVAQSVLGGQEMHFEYVLYISAIGSTFIADDNRSKFRYFGINLFGFLLVKVFFLYMPEGLLASSPPSFIKIYNGSTVMIIVIFGVYSVFKLNLKLKERLISLNNTLDQQVTERTKEIMHQSQILQQKNNEISTFSYIASHDLREPLRNILGFTQLIKQKIERKEYQDILSYYDIVAQSVDRMDTITKDIVAYVDLENKIKDNTTVDLQEMIKRIEASIPREHGAFAINTAPLPHVHINLDLAERLFINIILNSIQYCDKPIAYIDIAYTEHEDHIEIEVRDNGRGIEAELLDDLFVMFKRGHNDLSIRGSGIGLAACKKIVEGYHGKIWVSSTIKVGTSVFFTLPKAVEKEKEPITLHSNISAAAPLNVS